MIAYKKSKSETLKDIHRLERNVRRRIERIEARKDLPQIGAEAFRAFEQEVLETLSKEGVLSIGELPLKKIEKISRSIRYVNQLKSTSIKGATEYRDVYKPLQNKIDVLSKEQQRRFYSIYDKITSRFMGMDKYKYDIENYIYDRMNEGATDEDIFEEVFDYYDATLSEYGVMGNEKDIAVSFTSKLKDFSFD